MPHWTHLTVTGPHAGATLCGISREQGEKFAHINPRALEKPEVRAETCPHCLAEYVASFERGEDIPVWAETWREAAARAAIAEDNR